MAEKRPESVGTIDWNAVHTRLESVERALEQGWFLPPGEKAKILKERAVVLAVEAEEAPPVGEEYLNILEFVIAAETYGFESSFVREVYPLKEFTPLPCTPPFVFGIINVRGRIVSINDIRGIFDLPRKGLTELNKVIILKDKEMEFGVLADAVVGARSIPLSGLQPPPPTLTGIREEYLKGVTAERLVVLDARKMLTNGRLVVREEVL